MRLLRLALLVIPLLAFGLFFFDTALATRDERAVLTIIGRNLLDRRQDDTCLDTWTRHHFFSGTYGFGGGGNQPDQAWLDPIAQRARGRSVSLYAGAPASTRPVLISRTLDMLMGCSSPTQLSTPIFAGDFAFVSTYTPASAPIGVSWGEATALRRAGRGWVVVGSTVWNDSPVT